MNLHGHTLFLDGPYSQPNNDSQQPAFITASKSKDEEIKKLSEQIYFAIIKKLDDKGVLKRLQDQDSLLQYRASSL